MPNMLDRIKTSIFGSKENKIIDKLDVSLNKLRQELLNKNSLNQSDFVRDLLSKCAFNDQGNVKFFENITNNTALMYENKDRLNRYVNAEEICDSIPYCAKALKVLTDQIVSPDDITKEIINIFEIDDLNSSSDEYRFNVTFIKEIKDSLNLESLISDIIYDALKFGDQFIEICDVDSNELPITQMVLTENGDYYKKEIQDLEYEIPIPTIELNENEDKLEEIIKNKKVVLKLVTDELPNLSTVVESNNSSHIDINNVKLIVHDPAYVIKIQSNRYKMCLGYLVIPKYENSANSGLFNNGSNDKLTKQFTKSNLYQNMSNNNYYSGINQIYNDMLKYIASHLTKGDDVSINKTDTINILRKVLQNVSEDELRNLKIRYVPPNRMEHFRVYDKRFFPYGESIFHKSTYQAKMLIALETATTVKRLADSTERRIIYVESAGGNRTVKNVIESLKEGFKKKKYSLDTFGSIGSIPSQVTTYEDYYIPQKNGKRFVEFDTLQPITNTRDATDELKFFRDQIVASLDVPPSFVSLEENSVTKANLAQESNVFARTVIAYQSMFGGSIKNLFSKIFVFCKKERMPDIKITLSPPKLLQTEIYADHLDTLQRIFNIYTDLGIPKEYFKKRFLNIEWEEVDKLKAEKALDDRLTSEPKEGEDDMSGGMSSF